MVYLNKKFTKVHFAANASAPSSFTQTKKTDGRANNGRNLTQAARSKGGKIAHQRGTAHEFSSEEARAAGKIGGKKSQRRAFQSEESQD
jgi:hypothetical protein